MERAFNVIVCGENPDNRIEEYNSNRVVMPYVVYKLEDMENIYNTKLSFYETILNSKEKIDTSIITQAKLLLNKLKDITPFDYYKELSTYYTLDEENGNLLSQENPNGKFESCSRNDLLLLDEEWVSQLYKSEINWDKLHLNQNRVGLQERAYELCCEGLKPINDLDKQILENMSGLGGQNYWDKFKDKEEYAKYCESFGFYAILTKDNEYIEVPLTENEIKWKINFFDNYIKELSEDTLLTTYTCIK